MGKIIYIRHGKDRRSKHKHDEKLTEEGKLSSRKLSKDLLEKYGLPDVIYFSPFYRTRQTRKEMIKEIIIYKNENNIDKNIELKIEPKLGRFFTKKERKNPDISSKTFKKGAIINEHYDEFKQRVHEQLIERKKEDYELVWNITHTLVLLRVAEFSEISRNPHVEYLDYCVIEK